MSDLNARILGSRPRRNKDVEHNAAIMLRVPQQLRLAVEQRAKAEYMPLAAWVRRALRAGLRQKVRSEG
jgi:hypothetical protein